jgi:hypothetical protein
VAATPTKASWRSRWFGGVSGTDYLLALPFCVSVLVVPFLPFALVLWVVLPGQALFVGLFLLFLTFGYPVLRVKRPRAAWWVGTAVAAGSLFSALALNAVVATFNATYATITWLLLIPFTILNWKRLRPWTFGVFAAVILGHFVAMGDVGPILQTAFGMGLIALFFLLRDRDNIPRAPIVVTIAILMLMAHAYYFHFDVGGDGQIKRHPAARKVFEFTSQHGGWAGVFGLNPRFLTPSCRGDEFFVGAPLLWNSQLVRLDPATNQFQKMLLSGEISANLAQDCQSGVIFLGCAGAHEVLTVFENYLDPNMVPLRATLEGANIELLRLDRRLNRLYVSADNRGLAYVLQASDLAELGRIEFSSPVSDMVIDRQGHHDVIVATTTGEIARLNAGDLARKAGVHAGFGQVLCKIALDEKHRRLFVDSLFRYDIRILDADTLTTIAVSPQPRGSDYMQYDAKRDLLYVGNFFYGTIQALSFDGKALKKVWSVDVGKRVHYLTLDRLRDQLCFTSSLGGYCLALEALHPAPEETAKAAGEPGADETAEPTPAAAEPTPAAVPPPAALPQ